MQVNATSTIDPLATTDTSSASRVPIQTLGQDDFLKLLVTQMTSQDPMNPQKDTDFVAQMAQFSSLEQTKTMGSNISQLLTQQQVLQANDMLGRTVSLQVDSTTVASGTVSGVQIEAGTPKIVVNGQSFDLSQVLSITPPAASN